MQHIHLDHCTSTQNYLKKFLDDQSHLNDHLLVSTDKQTDGIGRYKKQWIDFENNLAFSFTLKSNPVATLTSLEIALLIKQFLETKNVSIKLKWPNDLINSDHEKIGGILINNLKSTLIVGVGINWGKGNYNEIPREEGIPKAGSIYPQLKINAEDKKNIPTQIYQFILENRMSDEMIKSLWQKSCLHYKKEVIIVDDQMKLTGVFEGIGDLGEAIISNNSGTHRIYSGSLLPVHGF